MQLHRPEAGLVSNPVDRVGRLVDEDADGRHERRQLPGDPPRRRRLDEARTLRPEDEAERLRTELFQRMRAFLEKYEFFCGPVNQLPPYPVDVEWPRSIAGVSRASLSHTV